MKKFCKLLSGLISTLIKFIDTDCLWCGLKALTKKIFEKPDFRGNSMCTLINKTGYELWRLGKIFMQSLTFKFFLSVFFLSKSTIFWRIWNRCLFSTFSSCKLDGATKIELFGQATVCLGILERKTIVLVAKVRALYRV